MQTKLYSLGINVDTQAFYNYPTIRDIANYIMNKSDKNISTLSDIENINIPEIRKINDCKHLEYQNIFAYPYVSDWYCPLQRNLHFQDICLRVFSPCFFFSRYPTSFKAIFITFFGS